MNIKWNATVTYCCLGCVAVGALAWSITLASHRGHFVLRDAAALEKLDQRLAPLRILDKQARQAEISGDYIAAERFYEKGDSIEPGYATYPLAKLHEKMGKYTEALAGYKSLIKRPGSYSTDSYVLVRCGDLDMIYGSKDDARDEYLVAGRTPSMYSDKTFAPIAAGENISKSAPLNMLRANAYYNAGTYYLCIQEVGPAKKYLELALSLEPNSALMRFGYARIYNGLAEDWLAEKEATGPLKTAIHKWRVGGNETAGDVTVTIKDGKATQTMTQYVPKGPVTTPHVPDPVMLGQAGWPWEGSPRQAVP